MRELLSLTLHPYHQMGDLVLNIASLSSWRQANSVAAMPDRTSGLEGGLSAIYKPGRRSDKTQQDLQSVRCLSYLLTEIH